MAVFKCKMCEANLEVSGNTTVVKCEYCGTTQTVPWAEDRASGNAAAGFGGNLENLLKRGNLSLEDKKWDDAEKYFDRVLDINVEEPRAYIGKLLTENRVHSLDELWQNKSWNSVKAMDNYKKAYRFAGNDLKKTLDEYYVKWAYRAAKAKSESRRISDVEEAVDLFTSIIGYKDSEEQAEKCRKKIYNEAVRLMESAYSKNDFLNAKSAFEIVSDYWDANLKAQECAAKAKDAALKEKEAAEEKKRIEEEEKLRAELHRQQMEQQIKWETAQKERHKKIILICTGSLIITAAAFCLLFVNVIRPMSIYNNAMKCYENGDYNEAIALFTKVDDYKDSYNMIYASYYAKGMARYENRDYDGAVSAFNLAGGYSDSEEMIKASYYAKGMELYEIECYSMAISNFISANGYNDSESMIKKIKRKYSSIRETLPTGIIDARDYVIAVKSNGAVYYNGVNQSVIFDLFSWTDIDKVSTGYRNLAGLKTDGTVVATGNNDYNQFDEVSNWSDIVDISCGFKHIVGLRSNGTVVSVGNNDYGQCDVSDWTDVSDISAGNEHTLGLKSDGTVVAVGNNEYGQCNVSDWTDIVAVSAGTYHSVGLKSNGTVVAVGNNSDKQCKLEEWTDIVAVSAGNLHSIGLKSDGTVVAVGNNEYGQCDVSDWTQVVAVTAADEYTVGIKSDGTTVMTWYHDSSINYWTDTKTINGLVITSSDSEDITEDTTDETSTEINENNPENTDEKISYYAAIRENLPTDTISARYFVTTALKSDGTAFCSAYKQKKRNWTDITAVTNGGDFVAVLKSDGTVILNGFTDTSNYDGVLDWTDIINMSAGLYNIIGIKSDGTIVATGDNTYGQCNISDWTEIVAVSAGAKHTVGLKSDGNVIAIGWNEFDQCKVSDWNDIVAISAGFGHTVGIKSNGTVVAVGNNAFNQCNISDWTDIVAVSAGLYHTVGLKSDGTAIAVGNNVYGQCDISDWTDIVAISAGNYHTVGLKSDGTIVAVGRNNTTQCDVSDWTDIKTTP